MNPYIILFNGPPRSGKDYGAQELAAYLWIKQRKHTHIEKFSLPLKQGGAGLLGVDYDGYYYQKTLEARKDSYIIPALNITWRQLQIDISEKFMKPVYGDNIFGSLMVDRLMDNDLPIVLVPDSGFAPEAQVLINHYGASKILLLRIHREGCSFLRDSRSYIELPVETRDIHNHGDGQYGADLYSIVSSWMETLDASTST